MALPVCDNCPMRARTLPVAAVLLLLGLTSVRADEPEAPEPLWRFDTHG